MRREFVYTVDQVSYSCIAEPDDAFFGKGIKIHVLDKDGRLRDRIKFNCHPEFDEFPEFQSRSHEELASIAIDRLMTGEYEASLAQARRHSLELLLCFNGIKPKY